MALLLRATFPGGITVKGLKDLLDGLPDDMAVKTHADPGAFSLAPVEQVMIDSETCVLTLDVG